MSALQAQNLAVQAAVIPGERLSDWILRVAGPHADTANLHWQVEAERAPQQRLRQAVLNSLRDLPDARLSDWLRGLALTGRLTVAIPDARWLQAAPDQDPILATGQKISLFPKQDTVTVITQAGFPCLALFVQGAAIGDYLQACLGLAKATAADRAWIAQADGRTANFGIAAWNLETQAEPGPGAVIWAPARTAGISAATSDNLIRFLATQEPGQLVSAGVGKPVSTPQRSSLIAPQSAQYTASDWGEIGLLQTPTARMAAAGDLRLHISRVDPYTQATVMVQPLDWLEAGFRYTDISNRLYGPVVAGDQSYKDKSFDFKARLRTETDFWPQIAVGMRDIGGTGLFSAEYLVANKRWGNWDASLGLGWGYLGSRGNLKNPLAFFGSEFETRVGSTSTTGGAVNTQAMFRGPVSLFGGVQWQSPSYPWVLKLELDGNNYQNEPLANTQAVTSPFNFGAVYRYSPTADFSVGIERGNRLMAGVTLHGGLDTLFSPKVLDAPAIPVRAESPAELAPAGWGRTAQTIEAQTGWSVRSISRQRTGLSVLIEADEATYLQARIERAIAVLHRDAPRAVERFVVQLQERGLAMVKIDVDRAQWVARRTQVEAPALRLADRQVLPDDGKQRPQTPAGATPEDVWRGTRDGLKFAWGPSFSQILGGPDGFVLYQLGVQSSAEYRFSDSTWLSGGLNFRLLDNYDNFVYTAPSDLPRVRTFMREYVTTSRVTLPVFQLTQVHALGNGHYVSAYGGMLESMFGGVGAEWLYRPWNSRVAWGVDLNYVRQRDFQQNFNFRDYTTSTGHATMYWDTGWNNVQLNLSLGRYLAGDVGATIDVKRHFPNGVAVGAYFTKTNVSAAQFGEGSFDKGVYVSAPFDALLPKSTPNSGVIGWNPLTRDGGAKLNRSVALFDLTAKQDARSMQWRAASTASPMSAEDASYIVTEPRPGLLANLGQTTATLGSQIADVPGSTWLLAGGAILASSLLDKSLDQWAVDNQQGTGAQIANASNALPYALALGTGLLYTGMAGPGSTSTAETAIKAAGYTLGANLMTKFMVGRARPSAELGNTQFDGFIPASVASSFASNHVALSFALVTPFAQTYHMPWLYGVAAATAVGRIQQRDHWASDTVAGAFMGYAIGSLLNAQKQGDMAMRLSVTPQAIEAKWPLK